MERWRITVMLGGPSAEREVSLRTGKAVAGALRSLGHEVAELDPQKPGWKLAPGTEVVFLALHGTYGEDGTVQTELDKLGVPYTGCDAEASRIAFDKVLTKQACVRAGVPTARYVVLDRPDASWPDGWAPPVVLKPVCQGSSVGLHFVDRPEQLAAALRDALHHDSRVLMEEKISGREVTVGVLGGQTLPLVEVRPKVGVYDYHNKYTPGVTDYFCPAPLPEAVAEEASAGAWKAFQAIGGRDYARIDVMLRDGQEPFVLEINTLPGMTETSLLPKAAAAVGMSYPQLCERMVDLALQRA